MRTFVAFAFTVVSAVTLTPRVARACDDDFERPRPVVSNDTAGALLAHAAHLEARAADDEGAAASLDRRADETAAQARSLRVLALRRGDVDRARLLARADDLAAQSAALRAQASQHRAEAASLRAEARNARERASRLAGWGHRRDLRPVASLR
jgi:hypothetical protein